MKHKVSVWAHVIMPMCIAIVVFVLLIAVVIIWSRCKRQKYKRSKMVDHLCEQEAVTHIVFPDDQYPSPDDPEIETTTEWPDAPPQRTEVILVPRDPLVLDHDWARHERLVECRKGEEGVLSKLCTRDTIDEGLGDDDVDADEQKSRSRSNSSVCTDCPPGSLESPKIPYADSQHSLLQMEV